MRKLLYIVAVAAAGLGGCAGDQITAPNQNNPDVSRVLASPADVETLIGNSYGSAFNAAFGSNTSIVPAMLVMSFENASGLANFGNGPRSGLPRVNTSNIRGNAYEAENARVFQNSQRAARTAATGLAKLNEPGFTIGTPAQDLRARAFAFFVMGYANGNVALTHDSLSFVTEKDTVCDGCKVAPLIGAQVAMPLALTQMDSAIAAAQTAIAKTGGFTLPGSWVPNNAFTAEQFIQMVRSYKARFRAGVARTPAQRAAVDWAQVLAVGAAGLPGDLMLTTNTNSNFTIADGQHYTYDTWSQQSPMIIGMADSVRAGCTAANAGDQVAGGCYDAWLATPLNNRYAFLIRTADQRFPSGDTRAAQRTASGSGNKPVPPRANEYFRNRVPTDPPADPWNLSQYDFYRFQAWSNGGRGAPYPVMPRAEIDMLMAEGYIRTGDFANAMAKINITRVANGGLPPLVGITSLSQPVPGGNACVPRVPTGPDYAHAVCGNIFEAMKWEKRMETHSTHMGAWYIDSRGWGDLPQYTALDFPVPFQELDVRKQAAYSTGGQGGNDSQAVLGTYGY
jgi:hypothetical protein